MKRTLRFQKSLWGGSSVVLAGVLALTAGCGAADEGDMQYDMSEVGDGDPGAAVDGAELGEGASADESLESPQAEERAQVQVAPRTEVSLVEMPPASELSEDVSIADPSHFQAIEEIDTELFERLAEERTVEIANGHIDVISNFNQEIAQ